jgi:predicted ATPase
LRDDVVTPQLAASFGDAMAFIRGAVETGSSKGAYLHGSFGSGKSYLMAVLYPGALNYGTFQSPIPGQETSLIRSG